MCPQHWAVCRFSSRSVHGPSGGSRDVVRGWWLLAAQHSAHPQCAAGRLSSCTGNSALSQHGKCTRGAVSWSVELIS